MKKLICPAVFLGCMLLVSLAPAIAQADEEIGIDRSNLTRQSEAVQEKTLRDIHALGATWFRDGFSTATPDAIAKFVNEVKLAKQNHLKFLAIVSPTGIDYDPGYHTVNVSEAFTKACGWGGGSPQISKINLSKLAQRLRTQLDAVKAANLSIDAFEIGNFVPHRVLLVDDDDDVRGLSSILRKCIKLTSASPPLTATLS